MKSRGKKVFLFWRYDLFPYVLGGIATVEGDRYCVASYQGSFSVGTPGIVAVCTLKHGRVIERNLRALRVEYGRAQKALEAGYCAMAERLLGALQATKETE